MGYTHYWDTHDGISPETWSKITNDVKRIIQASPADIAFELDEPEYPPIVNDYDIRFNGIGDDGHETFHLTRFIDDDFCKTARKPYDTVVTAILAVAKDHAGDLISVSSDGDEKDWKPGLDLASTTLGRPIAFPCTPRT